MADYLTHMEENGSINIAEDVVAAIVAEAVSEVEGVGAMGSGDQLSAKKALRGIHVEEEDDDAIVIDIFLMVRYGYAIPEVAQKVQTNVSGAVGGMTGFSVREVNVHVSGISFNT